MNNIKIEENWIFRIDSNNYNYLILILLKYY